MSLADIPKRKNLVDYLPPFMQSFKEMQQICRVEGKQADQIDFAMGRALDEAFIADCDEYGIQKYEKMIGILPEMTDTLERRKERVLLRWNDCIPYTIRTLIRKLNLYCGVNNYECKGDFENYTLCICTRFSTHAAVLDLEKTLDSMLPENMYFKIRNSVGHAIQGAAYGSCAITTAIRAVVETKG